MIGDIHFSYKQGDVVYKNNIKNFFDNIFFPEIRARGITTVFQTGDMFDGRKYNSNLAIVNAKECFFSKFVGDLHLHAIVGNHDIHQESTLYPNSLSLFLQEYIGKNVHIYEEPTTIKIQDILFDMIPWICEDNKEKTFKLTSTTKSKIAMAHPEINGFMMTKDQLCEKGLDRDVFSRYDYVIAGHFHTPSKSGNIHYLGSPSQHNWGDAGADRGFYILDTESLEIEFVRNPYTLFEKITYSDDLDIKSIPDVEGRYVIILLPEEFDTTKYKKFLDEIMTFQPLDLKAIESKVAIEGIDVTLEELETSEFSVVGFLTEYTLSIAKEGSDLDQEVLYKMYTEYYNKINEVAV